MHYEYIDENGIEECGMLFDRATIRIDLIKPHRRSSGLSIPMLVPDQSTAQMVGRSLFVKRYELMARVRVLRIHDVEKYVVTDEQRIEEYDFDHLELGRERMRLSVVTGVPTTIEATVRRIHLTVDELPNLVGPLHESRCLGGGRWGYYWPDDFLWQARAPTGDGTP
jgi:hypothetical protein